MSKVCTYFNERAVVSALGTWLPSLRRHYAGDVVLFHAGPCGLRDRKLDDGVLLVDVTGLLDGQEDRDIFFAVLKSWAFFAGGLPADEPVLIYDSADIGFQGKLDPLIEAVSKSGSRLHCMTEPREISNSPSMVRSLEAILTPELKERWWDVLMKQRILNTGLIAGRAETVGACFFELVESLPGVANNWIADQAWVNLYVNLHPKSVEVLSPKWCYDLRFYKYKVNLKQQYLDPKGNVIPVVHAAGYGPKNLFGVLREVAKKYSLPKEAEKPARVEGKKP